VGLTSIDDWRLLASRISIFIPEEVPQFEDVIRIYGKKVQVHQFNQSRLRDLNLPVLAISATHEGTKADEASTGYGGNLHPAIHISIGTKVMLLENIWVERGLANGALGTICDVVWAAGPLLLLSWSNLTSTTVLHIRIKDLCQSSARGENSREAPIPAIASSSRSL
jgi:hypothetical protein